MSAKNIEENLAGFVDGFFQEAHKFSAGILGNDKYTKLIKETQQ